MRQSKKLDEYRNGGEGCIKWAEDNICVAIVPPGSVIPIVTSLSKLSNEINPETGRSYRSMWEEQKKVLRECLRMRRGRFVHRLIVFCWQRGDGKSFLTCLIKLWRFCCWPRQKIMLGANSKDQSKFVHYDIIRDLILNSPNITKAIGRDNVKIKDITLRNHRKEIISEIRCVTSFSGHFSNITGYTFSEMYAQKNNDFFVQIDGSVRNIPNSFGVIDSTVSSKQHQLFRLYETWLSGKDPTLYFSYRCSKNGDSADYLHPDMTEVQLNSYRIKFPLGDFERYFLNIWSAGAENVFTEAMVKATQVAGVDGAIGNHGAVIQVIDKQIEIVESMVKISKKLEFIHDRQGELEELDRRIRPMTELYQLSTPQQQPRIASMVELEKLTETYDTDWSVLVGLDRADPMKTRSPAKTIATALAKGLPNSRSKHMVFEEGQIPHYLYVRLAIANLEHHSMEEMKQFINECDQEYDGVDMVTGERYGIWDLAVWCEGKDIDTNILFPNYGRQRSAFIELYTLYATGRFKGAPSAVPGAKGSDITQEEPLAFDHDHDAKKFGSREKSERYGVQDDLMYADGWCIYGAKALGVDDFRARRGSQFFGQLYQTPGLYGRYD